VDGRHAQARSKLDAFLGAWPRPALPPLLSGRVDAVDAGLAAAAGHTPDSPETDAEGEVIQDRDRR
jgi:hypothetical protein